MKNRFHISEVWNIVNNYFKSFNNSPNGYSRTKLTAYAFGAMTMIIEWVWLASGEWTYLTEVLIINTSLICALLGIRMVTKKKPNETTNKPANESDQP